MWNWNSAPGIRFLRAVAIIGIGLAFPSLGSAVSSRLAATVIDRNGNRHEVEKFTYQGRLEIEYYAGGQRRVVPLKKIDRIRLEGNREDEELAISVIFRSGRRESGRILSGVGVTPHQDALGGGATVPQFEGTTALGPFFIRVGDVREIILRHPEGEEATGEVVLKATVVTVNGKVFEVDHLRYRGDLRMDYRIGRKRRFADLSKVARIDFAEGGAGDELRPVTIVYWSGKKVQAVVDVSTVRLPGENDRNYYERIHAAFTGRTKTGAFSIGLHEIKQIRFHRAGEEEKAAEGDSTAVPGKKENSEEPTEEK